MITANVKALQVKSQRDKRAKILAFWILIQNCEQGLKDECGDSQTQFFRYSILQQWIGLTTIDETTISFNLQNCS